MNESNKFNSFYFRDTTNIGIAIEDDVKKVANSGKALKDIV